MNNFMQCNQMMFGSTVKYCITYKTAQKNFNIYTRKYQHEFKVTTSVGNYEFSRCLNIVTNEVFLVSNIDKIHMFRAYDF